MKKINLIEFIQNNSNWEELLTTEPYFLTIKRLGKCILFKYNQTKSDFNNILVRECRGIILEEGTFNVLAYPFNKFANYGEGYADKIDFSSAKILEKIDGSLIKIWFYNNKWRISSMSCIDAKEAILSDSNVQFKNFYDLFIEATKRQFLNWDKLCKDNTYIFELVSPYTKVVVPYDNIKIYHIGTRNNKTLEELYDDIGIQKPKEYHFKSIDDIINTANNLPYDEEGYVIVDQYWKRIKIKSPAYVATHYLRLNKKSDSKLLTLIKKNEIDELLCYFPEYKNKICDLKNRLNVLITKVKKDIDYYEINKSLFKDKRQFAVWANKGCTPFVLFKYYENPNINIEDILYRLTNNKMLNILYNIK